MNVIYKMTYYFMNIMLILYHLSCKYDLCGDIIIMKKHKLFKRKERKVDVMGAMTKPKFNLPVIDKDKSKKFIKVSNQQKLTGEFLKKCHKSAELFKKDF